MNSDSRSSSEDNRAIMIIGEFDTGRVKNKRLDIKYGPLPEQLVDVYYPPEGEGPFPVLFYVHGGGWIIGSKTECAIDCIIDALDFGYVVISVNYRLAPYATFPEFIFDVKTAVRWARANAGEYRFDPARFGMLGDSAGGHIALMVGFTEKRPEYEGNKYGYAEYSSEVQAICDIFGLSDLDYRKYNKWFEECGVVPDSDIADDSGGLFMEVFGSANPSLLTLISPISILHKDIPPVLIQHGRLDTVVACQHSTSLAERITDVCGADRVELSIYDDRWHESMHFLTREHCLETLAFFDKHLK